MVCTYRISGQRVARIWYNAMHLPDIWSTSGKDLGYNGMHLVDTWSTSGKDMVNWYAFTGYLVNEGQGYGIMVYDNKSARYRSIMDFGS